MNFKGHTFISAVIVAAGKSTRMNMDINKQYLEIGGMPVLAHALNVFEKCMEIDEIILVVNSEEISYCKNNIIDKYGFKKIAKVVPGGDERQFSVYNGLKQVNGKCEIVLIHDGARPFITEDIILEGIEKTKEFGAACIAVPMKDTVKVVGNGDVIESTPDRNKLWAVQTPQIFRYELIMKAYEKACKDGYTGTDDTVLVERLGYNVHVVLGNYYNIKITTKEDLVIAEAIAEAIQAK